MHPYCQRSPQQAYLTDEITNLFGLSKSTTSSIANRPARFLLGFEFTMLQQVNKRRNKVRINNRLDLAEIACSDVGYRPTCLLSNGFLGAGKKT